MCKQTRLKMPLSNVLASICVLIAMVVVRSQAERPDVSLCPLNEYIDENDQTVREFFECPGPEDPPNHRGCCDQTCCPIVDSVLQVDLNVAMGISLTVICICIVSGIIIIVCCFVSSCPMYDTCSGSWSTSECRNSNPFVGGYIPSDMHPLTLDGSKEVLTNGTSSKSRSANSTPGHYHRLAAGVSPVKVAEADHV